MNIIITIVNTYDNNVM